MIGMETCRLHMIHSNSADSDQSSAEINFTCASSLLFFFPSRRRKEKLQAHLKESRSLKNYTANSHNALDAKMRAPNINLQMHEVTTAVFTLPPFGEGHKYMNISGCSHSISFKTDCIKISIFLEDNTTEG